MAKIITQGVADIKWKDINVCASVGRGGANRMEDVMVVQALMKYALERLDYFRGEVFPVPSGVADSRTIALIEKFQRYLRRNSTKVSVDGRIDPARGLHAGNRKRLLWTIQQLNHEAEMKYIIQNNNFNTNAYIDDLCRQYPQVNAILLGSAVGTLNLGLE